MSGYASLKVSARSWNPTPLPSFLDFLAPTWTLKLAVTANTFFGSSCKPAFSFTAHLPPLPSTSKQDPTADLLRELTSIETFPHFTRIEQATPVAYQGYTAANYGLATREWATPSGPSPSPRSFNAPWRSHTSSFWTLIPKQRQLTTLPSPANSASLVEEPAVRPPAGVKSIPKSFETLDRKFDKLETLLSNPSTPEQQMTLAWNDLLKNFWKPDKAFFFQQDFERPVRLARLLLNHGLLMEAWDVRKVFLRHAKKTGRTVPPPVRDVFDQIYEASLQAKHFQKMSHKRNQRFSLGFRAWSMVSGLQTIIPFQHLLHAASLAKAFFAFTASFPPMRNINDYEMLICAAASDDETSMLERLWAELDASPHLRPTYSIHSSMINHFARRRDPDSIELLITSMQKHGQTVNRKQWTNLMRAHTTAANWQAVSDIFQYMESSTRSAEKPDLKAVNVVLRAEMLAGAPWRIMRELVASLPSRGFKPDVTTMAILMESAVDLNLLGPAEAIFAQMDRSKWLKPNVVHFGIMIKAFLVRRDPEVAQQYLDEMVRRGLHPSAILYAQIIHAYLSDQSSASSSSAVQHAEVFLQEYEKSQESVSTRMPGLNESEDASLNSLMVPFIASFARTFRPQIALEYFRKVSNRQLPNHVAFSALLDAYRRVGDVTSMKTVWDNLYTEALKDTISLRDGHETVTRGRANYLCLPLSSMVQGMAAADSLEEISTIWQRMHRDGFGFDCSNWNHLCQALLSHGEWLSACKVAEQVLLSPEPDVSQQEIELFSARRVRQDPETPSRSHQERSVERRAEQSQDSRTHSTILDAGRSTTQVEPILSAFSGVHHRFFWRVQQKTKAAIYAESLRRMGPASASEYRFWQQSFPKLERLVTRTQSHQDDAES